VIPPLYDHHSFPHAPSLRLSHAAALGSIPLLMGMVSRRDDDARGPASLPKRRTCSFALEH
jgi:hypothetical protein